MVERWRTGSCEIAAPEILREVASGATYEINNHGQVVAVLAPADSRVDLRVRPPRVERRFATLARLERSESVSDAIDDLRGGR